MNKDDVGGGRQKAGSWEWQRRGKKTEYIRRVGGRRDQEKKQKKQKRNGKK